MPLSALRLVRIAYALDGRDRVTARLHRSLMERTSPELAAHRFAGDGWREVQPRAGWSRRSRLRFEASRLLGHRWRIDHPHATGAERPDSALTNLAAHQRGEEGPSERVELVRELLADTANPAWDHLDRSAVADAATRYGSLPRAAQVELMGAATAALWLRDGPT
jgi:hypothetical protein